MKEWNGIDGEWKAGGPRVLLNLSLRDETITKYELGYSVNEHGAYINVVEP